jgi:two-component system nitrate/nitrite response regulator NarL
MATTSTAGTPLEPQPDGKTITVVVADDHPIYREGVANVLRHRREFELVGICRDGHEALAAIQASSPDVALLNVQIAGLDGIEILRQLRENGEQETRVAMLSAADDGATIYEAIAAGAAAYLLKDADHAEVCDALLAVAAGRTVLPSGVHERLADEIRSRSEPGVPLLSPREQEVLRLASEGDSARDMAERLIISVATVKTHLQHIYEKLGATDRASAVAAGIRSGIIS